MTDTVKSCEIYSRPRPTSQCLLLPTCLILLVRPKFLCSGLGSVSDASQAMVITAWSVYAFLLVAINIIKPTAILCVRHVDESGKTIWLRRPVVGWKSTEMVVAMDELASGTYDRDHGIEDRHLCAM